MIPDGSEPDPHTVSAQQAETYYAGLPSRPIFLYGTGQPWVPPSGAFARSPRKELRPVFGHPIVDRWSSGLADEVIEVLDKHELYFTSIDVVRFKVSGVAVKEYLSDEENDSASVDSNETVHPQDHLALGPIVIWIGVWHGTPPSLAHNAAHDILLLLTSHQLLGIDVEFRESEVSRFNAPQLFSPVSSGHPLANVIGPLTPALGLGISTTISDARLQGTMGLYLNKGDSKNSLLGLTCRHVLSGVDNNHQAMRFHRNSPRCSAVVHLGRKSLADVRASVERETEAHQLHISLWEAEIAKAKGREASVDEIDAASAKEDRVAIEALVEKAHAAVPELKGLLKTLRNHHWSDEFQRILGPVLYAPPVAFGVGTGRYTEDWGVLRIDRTKLGAGFQGNRVHLATKMSPFEFSQKCYPRGDANWTFTYPPDRLLPLRGTISTQQMRQPDMWDANNDPCLIVVKNGDATGTTLGRANGVFSVIRTYFIDPKIHQTSMEWTILNYDGESGAFSKPGDSGSIIADSRGRIGGLLTGGAGDQLSADVTYATPFEFILERIRDKFPNANLDVQTD